MGNYVSTLSNTDMLEEIGENFVSTGIVGFLHFLALYKIPSFLREAQNIDRTKVQTFHLA